MKKMKTAMVRHKGIKMFRRNSLMRRNIFRLAFLTMILVVSVGMGVLARDSGKTETHNSKEYVFKVSEVDRIYSEHKESIMDRNNASKDFALQIVQNQETEEVTEETTKEATDEVAERVTEQVTVTIRTPELVEASPAETVITQIQEEECTEQSEQIPEETSTNATLSADGPGEVYYYTISYEEKLMIAKVVWKEARGESFEGQVAVAATVFNRLNSSDSSIENDSIYSVVHQAGAYASISDVTDTQAETCMEAVEAACKGYDPTRQIFENGARFFYNPDWTGPEELARREGVVKMVIGNHTFHDDFAY